MLAFRDCPALVALPDLGALKALRKLDLSDCPSLASVGDLAGLESLEQLDIYRCKLTTLPVVLGSLKRLRKLLLQENLELAYTSLKHWPSLTEVKVVTIIPAS